jgi:outer membrane receptor for monomeric catechols
MGKEANMQHPGPAGRTRSVRPRLVLRRTPCLVLMALACGAATAQDEGVATLQSVQVIGNADSTTTEGTGSYTPRATAASTGLPLTLRETPQSVTVVTRQRMDDENMLSLVDVMASTPGISVQNYDSERYSFNSRGFSVSNYMYDGIPTSFDTGYAAGESSLDPIIYDRVEVVRGATGLLTGAGNPSASINLVRKHATSREFKADMSVSAVHAAQLRRQCARTHRLGLSGQSLLPGWLPEPQEGVLWRGGRGHHLPHDAERGFQLPGQRPETQQLGRLPALVRRRRPHGLEPFAEHRGGLEFVG